MFHAIIGSCTGRKDAVIRAVPVDEDDRSDVRAYLETMVGKRDTVALLVVSRWKAAAVVQEIQRVEDLARPESVRRLDALNRDGYDVYCTVNTVNPAAAAGSRRGGQGRAGAAAPPPRVRGSRPETAGHTPCPRSIPACAGEPLMDPVPPALDWDRGHGIAACYNPSR